MPAVLAPARRPSLWIGEREPCVAFAVQLLARDCGFVDAQIFTCKRKAIKCLRAEVNKPALLVTDYLSGHMRGTEFIRLTRHASPATKLIFFSAAVGNIEGWVAVAGLSASRPDAFVEKPNTRKLMTVLCQMR
jgi:response regulator RpfG family c-di-GMP phosphodiesterase